MSQYAELLVDVFCPNCLELITSEVCFQWGKVPNVYSIGERINWLFNISGEILLSFTLYSNQDKWNAGDSSFKDLLILDSNFFSPELNPKCIKCNYQIDGIVIFISNEIIDSVSVLPSGELYKKYGVISPLIDIILLNNEEYIPRYDFYDPPIIVR